VPLNLDPQTLPPAGFGMPIPTGESLPGALPTHLGKRSWIGEILQAQAAQHAVQVPVYSRFPVWCARAFVFARKLTDSYRGPSVSTYG
jgi:hypothetical protein